MKKMFITLAVILFTCVSVAQTEEELTQEMIEAYEHYRDSVEATLNYQYGTIDINGGLAQIVVPAGFKFLDAEQSEFVLTELWENPPSESLGMLLPEDISPLSDNFTYAVEITYSDEGYISDEDAEGIDYDELLEEMQKDTQDGNEFRIENGYDTIELIGWASEPFYDNDAKKLHWAKELKFGDYEINTLNYNIRVLGREGYLNLNAIGDMDALPHINNDIDQILASVEFTEGNRYADFNPDIDKVAAYGIGGLVAGKVLAKAGVFAGLMKFWKIILVGIVGAFGVLRKKLFRKEE